MAATIATITNPKILSVSIGNSKIILIIPFVFVGNIAYKEPSNNKNKAIADRMISI
jgi:hypothetical protein